VFERAEEFDAIHRIDLEPDEFLVEPTIALPRLDARYRMRVR
jgi:hypothetical protein